jgi:hypothetical protein
MDATEVFSGFLEGNQRNFIREHNMDETGFQIGILACAWVLIAASSGTTPYPTHPSRQEWVSTRSAYALMKALYRPF